MTLLRSVTSEIVTSIRQPRTAKFTTVLRLRATVDAIFVNGQATNNSALNDHPQAPVPKRLTNVLSLIPRNFRELCQRPTTEAMMIAISKRGLMRGLATVGACAWTQSLTFAQDRDPYDFVQPMTGWKAISGDWAFQDVPGAKDGRALVQRATENEFNVIVAPGGPYGNVLVTARFKPISGREDASGGIVFRFSEGRYYVVRANALEDNFRLYYYDRGRFMITSASIKSPALGQWHKLQVLATGDRIEAWLNDQHLIDQRDRRFRSGSIGLWTKADSVTAFDDIAVMPYDN
jgi:Domain of Unknown Function (DUF1080)